MRNNIKRTLAYEDPEQGRKLIGQDKITSFTEPVVILGDPGLGKSVLTQELGKQDGLQYFHAGTFVRCSFPSTPNDKSDRPIIDGLDQITSVAPGAAIEHILEQLARIGNPPFILSCREADWLGAADRVRIEDDYGVPPLLLHLQPFAHEDARNFLSQEFPDVDADGILDHLADHGIEALYGNPLTLRLFGEVAQVEGSLPESRVQLLDHACPVLLKEDNLRHHLPGSHAYEREKELLLASGAIFATQLLCGRTGVHIGPNTGTPDHWINIIDVTGLMFGHISREALKTRLFCAQGEGRFTHIHRVIAEYLGAMWLARCFEDGVSERRIFSLLRHREGVPTSLRGLHAWMAHFSDVLAKRCIAADPYGVLRYGDAEKISLGRARALLDALKQLSMDNPYFRSEDWGPHPAAGLMREELRDDILAIINAPDHAQLTGFLLEAMVGTEFALTLRTELEIILFARDRDYQERMRAAGAISSAISVYDRETFIHQLLEMNDGDSTRIAFYLLHEVGAGAVCEDTVLDTVLAYPGLDVKRDFISTSGEIWYPPGRLFRNFSVDNIPTFLDRFVERAGPLLEGAHHSARSFITDSVTHLTAQALDGDPEIHPERLWTWLGWMEERDSLDSDIREHLTRVFRENQVLRVVFLKHVLLTSCADNLWLAYDRLGEIGFGLVPTSDDLAAVLRSLGTRDAIDPDTWSDLLQLDRSPVVRDAAAEMANGDPELLSIFTKTSVEVVPEWRNREEQRRARAKAERQKTYKDHRDTLAANATDVAAGDFRFLVLPAAVYLNRSNVLPRHFCLDSEASPQERLKAVFGDTLSEQVLLGFIGVLGRNDLPSASKIAQARCENKHWHIEAPMICGVAEMIRQECPINSIDRDTLAAVYMAWRHARESNAVGPVDIGADLEAVLFKTEEDQENHFRASIEPQMGCNLEHIWELRRLANEPRFSALAGRLAIEWLRRYPALSPSTQRQLLICALNHATHEQVRALGADIRTSGHWDDETKTIWLLADYVVDFESHRHTLHAAATDNPDLIWTIRNHVRRRRRERLHRLSLDQLVFIVRAFGTHWPLAEPPVTTWMGRFNPWDASNFIRATIYEIASNPTPEATEALEYLITNHAPSYGDLMKHALALQCRARWDSEYTPPTPRHLMAVMRDEPPETIDDMRAFFADRIEDLQGRIRGSNTHMWEAYWVDGKPRNETFCRDRLIEHISRDLPVSIRFEPEMHMPDQKRVDIAAVRNTIGLPIEIKGQWHREVWNAAGDQLDANYTRDWRAEGRGVYIVLWFGDCPNKQLPRHPEGLGPPETPCHLKRLLIDRLPEARRPWIDVFVIDVGRPPSPPE